jgi:uncharacterized membrane protein
VAVGEGVEGDDDVDLRAVPAASRELPAGQRAAQQLAERVVAALVGAALIAGAVRGRARGA